jgi:hypothetical protein
LFDTNNIASRNISSRLKNITISHLSLARGVSLNLFRRLQLRTDSMLWGCKHLIAILWSCPMHNFQVASISFYFSV